MEMMREPIWHDAKEIPCYFAFGDLVEILKNDEVLPDTAVSIIGEDGKRYEVKGVKVIDHDLAEIVIAETGKKTEEIDLWKEYCKIYPGAKRRANSAK